MEDNDEVRAIATELKEKMMPPPKILDSKRYRDRYEKTKFVVNNEVRRSYDNGDRLALALRGKDLAFLRRVAKDNDMLPLFERYGHLNPGQVRMSFSQRLRTKIKDGIPVLVDGQVIETLV